MNGHDDRGRDRSPEHPRSEPEIIPPERERPRPDVFVWVAGRDGARRATLTLPGLLTILLAFFVAGLVAALILIAALGAVLLWVPFIILVIGLLLLSATARQYWWRFRNWLSRR